MVQYITIGTRQMQYCSSNVCVDVWNIHMEQVSSVSQNVYSETLLMQFVIYVFSYF